MCIIILYENTCIVNFQDGINWLGFLKKYNLHGILCDDMGLGKTLQTLCVVACDTHERTKENSDDVTASRAGAQAVMSLVVCPTTVAGHWMCEVEKFFDKKYLRPLHYYGSPSQRQL